MRRPKFPPPSDVEWKIRKMETDIKGFLPLKEKVNNIGIGLSTTQERELDKKGITPFELFVESERSDKYDLTIELIMTLTFTGNIGDSMGDLPEDLRYKIQNHIPDERGIHLLFTPPETITDYEIWFKGVNKLYDKVIEKIGYQDASAN